jgi:hypothetical protein
MKAGSEEESGIQGGRYLRMMITEAVPGQFVSSKISGNVTFSGGFSVDNKSNQN